ncbi:MAG: hypothetical protein DRI69_01455 [Bacteroidetes bacterium]|nr:MAG: hypothetical protein DRI69_01455 [Bacteroidota bacterium]
MTTFLQLSAITVIAAFFGLASPDDILDLTCPDDISVVITEDACSKTIEITAPDIPVGFMWVSYQATYTFLGIPPLGGGSNTDLVPPDPMTVDVTPGETTSVEFWGGDNVVEYVATDMGGVEMVCEYSIAVLDGFAPYWEDHINQYNYPGECGIDDAIDDIWFGNHVMSPLDNCCNANADSPVITDTTHLCGGSIDVRFYVIGYDGSGDDQGNADDTPCTLGVNPASPLFTDTLWITVNLTDNMPPVIEGAPAPDTISCSATPVMPDLTASDVCFGNLTDSIEIVVLDDSNLDCGNGSINRIVKYQATVDDDCGNADTVTWTVYFKNDDDLVVDLGDDLLLCTEQNHILDAGAGADTYTWSTGESTQEINVTTTGSYYVTVTSGSCCAIDSIFLSFGMDVVLNASGGALTCAESTVAIMAGVTTDMYVWTGPGGFMSTDQNPVVDTAGTYYITATSNEGCSGMDSVKVVYDTLAPDISVSFGAVDCQTERIAIMGQSITDGVTYAWTGPGGFAASTADTSIRLAGDYTLIVTAPNGCQSEMILNNPSRILSPMIKVKTTLATNGMDGSAWAEISGGASPFVFIWSTGEMQDTIHDLPIDQYSVTVTDDVGCTAVTSFFVDPQVTICDLSSTLISSNTMFSDTLEDLNVLTPSLSEVPCIIDFYGVPISDPLLGRTFLYDYETDLNTITLSIHGDSDKKAFIFKCRDFVKHTEQECIGSSDENGDYTFDSDPGMYYIVVSGTNAGEYDLVIQQNLQTTACDAVSGQLFCGETRVDAVSGLSFFSSETGYYDGCYRGPSNKFLGSEKVYRYEVQRAVTATLRLTPDSDMGVFLYNYQCATKCISVFEAMQGVTTEDVIELNPGLYFIIIDQIADENGKGFTLDIECEDLDDALWPDRRQPVTCEFSDSSHNIFFPANSIKLPQSVIGTSPSVLVYFLSPDKKSKIGEPKRLSLSAGGILDALGDKIGDLDTCGYLESETITYAFKTDDNLVLLGAPDYKLGSAASFIPGGSSELDSILQAPGPSSILASVQPLEQKDIAFDTNRTEVLVQTSSNQLWEVIKPNPGGWIDSVGVGSNPSSRMGKGVDKIIIWHSKNTGDTPNNGIVRIKFPVLGELLRVNLEQSWDTSSVAVTYLKDIPGIDVFPNPSSGTFFVKFPTDARDVVSIKVINLNGQLIQQNESVELVNSLYEIDLDNVLPGIYFVEVLLQDRAVVKRIVLNRSN